MKKWTRLAAIIAFALGLSGFRLYAQRLKEEALGGTPVGVIAVAEDLPVGGVLQRSALVVVDVPQDYLDERRVRAADVEKVVGARLATALKAGEQLVWSDIESGEARRHLATLVARGRRAYTLPESANPFRGLLKAGDEVDVLQQGNAGASTVLSRVTVLAVGERLFGGDDGEASGDLGPGGVTLSLLPHEVEKILGVEHKGRLRLALRNADDRADTALRLPNKGDAGRRASHADASERKEIEHVR